MILYINQAQYIEYRYELRAVAYSCAFSYTKKLLELTSEALNSTTLYPFNFEYSMAALNAFLKFYPFWMLVFTVSIGYVKRW